MQQLFNSSQLNCNSINLSVGDNKIIKFPIKYELININDYQFRDFLFQSSFKIVGQLQGCFR